MITNQTGRPNIIDYLKLIAVITMLVDHIGYFLFPDEVWMRFIGRYSFPLFFVIIGLHGKFYVNKILILSAVVAQLILVGYGYMFNIGVMPLSILGSIVLVKYLLYQIDKHRSHNFMSNLTVGLCIIAAIFAKYTVGFIEYGTTGITLGIFGYLVYKQANHLVLFMCSLIGALGLYLINMVFPFDQYLIYGYTLTMFLGLFRIGLHFHKLFLQFRTYTIIDQLVVSISKNALSIYLVHIVLLGIIKFIMQAY